MCLNPESCALSELPRLAYVTYSDRPGIAYYLSRFYRRSELAFRLALYIVMGPLSGAFSGLLASAILRLDSFGGTQGWQMIFVIEGIITVGFALLAFVTLTDRPETVCPT